MLHPRASPLRILDTMAETAGKDSEPEIARLLTPERFGE